MPPGSVLKSVNQYLSVQDTGRSWVQRGNVVRSNTFRSIRTRVPVFLGSPSVQGQGLYLPACGGDVGAKLVGVDPTTVHNWSVVGVPLPAFSYDGNIHPP